MSKARPSALRRALRSLANPRIIGWPMFWSSYGLFLLDRLPIFGGVRLDEPVLGSIPALAWVVTIAQLTTFAVLLAARWTFLRTQRASRHPSWTVLTFLVAALIGDVAGALAGRLTEPLLGAAMAPNALGNAWIKALALCVIGIVIAALLQHRDSVTALRQVRDRLVLTRQQAEDALATEGERTLAVLHGSIDEALDRMSTQDPVASVQALRSAAEEVVRPLSHELAGPGPQFLPAPDPTPRSIPWRAVLAQVPAIPLISPALMAIVMTVLASRDSIVVGIVRPAPTAASTTLGPVTASVDLRPLVEAVLVLVAVFLATWGSAWLVRRLIGPLLASRSARWQWAIMVVGIAVVGAFSQGLIALAFRLPGFPPLPSISPWVNFALVTPLLLVALTNGVIRAIALRRQGLLAQIEGANADLAWEIARVNERLWALRRDLSRAIHGPLQASLNAGALGIDSAMRHGTLTPGAIEQVRERIQRALGGLVGGPTSQQSLDRTIDQTSQLWSEVCRIRAEVSPAARALLDQDRLANATVAEIVTEACANAVIHGQAGRADIDLRATDARTLRITITDDGTSPGDDQPGLGSRFLDDVCIDWSREHGPEGTTLIVHLPAEPFPGLSLPSPASASPAFPPP